MFLLKLFFSIVCVENQHRFRFGSVSIGASDMSQHLGQFH